MPINEYRCTKCGRIIEHYRKISDPVLEYVVCEKCSTKRVRALAKLIPSKLGPIHVKGGTPKFYK